MCGECVYIVYFGSSTKKFNCTVSNLSGLQLNNMSFYLICLPFITSTIPGERFEFHDLP